MAQICIFHKPNTVTMVVKFYDFYFALKLYTSKKRLLQEFHLSLFLFW